MNINESIVRDAEAGGFVIYAQPNANEAIRVPITSLAPLLVSALASTLISGDADNGIVLGGDNLLYGSNIYNRNGALVANRTVTGGGFNLTFTGVSIFIITDGTNDNLRVTPTITQIIEDSGAGVSSSFTVNQGSTESVNINGTNLTRILSDSDKNRLFATDGTLQSYLDIHRTGQLDINLQDGTYTTDIDILTGVITISITNGAKVNSLIIDQVNSKTNLFTNDAVDNSDLEILSNQLTFDLNTIEKFFIDLVTTRLTQGVIGSAWGQIDIQPTGLVITASTTANQNTETHGPNQTVRSIINLNTLNEAKYTQNITGVGLIPKHLIESFDGTLRSYIEILKNKVTSSADDGAGNISFIELVPTLFKVNVLTVDKLTISPTTTNLNQNSGAATHSIEITNKVILTNDNGLGAGTTYTNAVSGGSLTSTDGTNTSIIQALGSGDIQAGVTNGTIANGLTISLTQSVLSANNGTDFSNLIVTFDQATLRTNPSGVPNNEINLLDGTGIVITSVLDDILINTTAGDIKIDPTGHLNLILTGTDDLQINGSAGNAGQVLTSAGANLPPVWGNSVSGYTGTFVIADWAAGTTLTITGATHGRGNGFHSVTVFDAANNIVGYAVALTNVNVNPANGDVTLTGVAFDGYILII